METKIIVMLILSIGLVSAIYPGETEIYPNEIGSENLIYNVSGNSSLVNINIEINSTSISISIPGDATPDTFSLTFIENITNEIQTISIIQSSSGTCSYNKNYDWECSEWGECINNERVRTCNEYNNCRNTYKRPSVTESCLVEASAETEIQEEPELEIEPEEPKSNIISIIIIFLLLLIILLVIAIWVRRGNKKTKKLNKKRKK